MGASQLRDSRSSVIAAVACPRRRCTALTLAPAEIADDTCIPKAGPPLCIFHPHGIFRTKAVNLASD